MENLEISLCKGNSTVADWGQNIETKVPLTYTPTDNLDFPSHRTSMFLTCVGTLEDLNGTTQTQVEDGKTLRRKLLGDGAHHRGRLEVDGCCVAN